MDTTLRTLEINLPFLWIDAAARDEISKENLVNAVLLRHDKKFKYFA